MQLTEEEINHQLKVIEEKRTNIEYEYNNQRKKLEEANDSLFRSIKELNENLSDNLMLREDPVLQRIYNERQESFNEMKQRQIEYGEFLEYRRKSELKKLDEDELELEEQRLQEEEIDTERGSM